MYYCTYLVLQCMSMETSDPARKIGNRAQVQRLLGATEATIFQPSHEDHCKVIPKKVDAGG